MATYQYKASLGKRIGKQRWVSTNEHTGGNLTAGYTKPMPTMLIGKPGITLDLESATLRCAEISLPFYIIAGTFTKAKEWADIAVTLTVGDDILDVTITSDFTWSIDVPVEMLIANTSSTITAILHATDPFTNNIVENSDSMFYAIIEDCVENSSISCSDATNKIALYDNGDGIVTSLTFFVSLNGIITSVPCNGTVSSTDDAEGDSPDGLLTAYLKTLPELIVTGDVWNDITIANASTTNDLRLSIWIEGTDATIWSVYDDGLNFNPPIETNPTYSTDVGANKQGFQVCLCKAVAPSIISCDGAINTAYFTSGLGNLGVVSWKIELDGVEYTLPDNSDISNYYMPPEITAVLDINGDGDVLFTNIDTASEHRVKLTANTAFEIPPYDTSNPTINITDTEISFCLSAAT